MTAYSSSTAPAFRNPHRVSITLPHSTYHQLLERSDFEGRSMSNLAAFLLETSLEKDDLENSGLGSRVRLKT